MLAVLQSISIPSGNFSVIDILISVSITLAFIFGVLLIGSKTIHKFINFIGKHNHHEILLLVVLGIAFGLSSSGGELALVVAKGGIDTGVTSAFILPMIGAMTIITTFI